MANPAFNHDFTTITACEDTVGWVGLGSAKFAQELDIVKQGNAAVSFEAKSAAYNGAYYNYGTPIDLTGKHIMMWMWVLSGSFIDTFAAGGLRIHVRDTAGNYGEWTVAGGETGWVGQGWRMVVIDSGKDFDFNGGADPDITDIQYYGCSHVYIAAANKVPGVAVDIIRVGDLLKISGGGPIDPLTLQSILDYDESQDTQYGFITSNKVDVFEIAGQVIFEPSASGTYLKDDGVQLAFSDGPVHPDYHKIKLWATGSAVMDFQLGESINTGTATIALGGTTLYSVDDVNRYLLDFTHPDIDSLKLYGMTAKHAGEARFGWETGTLGGAGGIVELVDCTFDDSFHISRDVDADYPLFLRGVISNPSGTGPSLRMFDDFDPLHDQDAFSLVAAYGLGTENATGTSLNYVATNPYRDITMGVEGQLWRFVNPSFSVENGFNPHILWSVSTGTFEEQFDYKTEVRNPAGDPYQNTRIYVFDSADTDFQIEAGSTNATGSYEDTLLKRNWLDGQTGTASNTQGPFVQRLLRFGQSPFEAALTVDAAIEQIVTLVDDGGVELSEAAADLVSGTVYEHGTGTAGGNLIAFDNGTILFAGGDIVVGASSGATGTVRDKTGDAAGGTIFIVDRNAIAFQDGEDLDVIGATNATANLTSGTGGADIDYHWEVRASAFGLDDLYSWQASKSAKASPDDWVISMLRHRVDLFSRSGGDYWTENIEGEGVFISERGAGNVLYLTSDGGWEWTPPQQYTLTLTGLITGSGGSEARIYARVGYNDTGAELGGVETAGVEFQYSYEHGGSDIPVIIVVFHTEYDPVWQHYDLGAADASLPINQGFSRVYSNP